MQKPACQAGSPLSPAGGTVDYHATRRTASVVSLQRQLRRFYTSIRGTKTNGVTSALLTIIKQDKRTFDKKLRRTASTNTPCRCGSTADNRLSRRRHRGLQFGVITLPNKHRTPYSRCCRRRHARHGFSSPSVRLKTDTYHRGRRRREQSPRRDQRHRRVLQR